MLSLVTIWCYLSACLPLHILRKTNKDQMVFSLQITILTVCHLYFEMCWLPRIKIKNNNTENLLPYILQWILMFFSPSNRPVCVARGRSVHLHAQGTSAAAPGHTVGSTSSDDDRMFVPRRPMASSLADLSSTGPAGDSDSGVDSGPAKSHSNPAKQILNSLVCGAKTTNRKCSVVIQHWSIHKIQINQRKRGFCLLLEAILSVRWKPSHLSKLRSTMNRLVYLLFSHLCRDYALDFKMWRWWAVLQYQSTRFLKALISEMPV